MAFEPFIDFSGRKVLVTGASSGLGRAIAVEISWRGGFVILSGRDASRLAETAGLIAPGQCAILPIELREISTIAPAIQEYVKHHGKIYGFCHSAGVAEMRPLNLLEDQGLRSLMAVNLNAGMELAKCLSRRDVMEAEGGAFLFIASVAAWVASPGQIAYSASKGALVAAARSMALELARKRVRVNTLSPGVVRTPMSESAHSGLTNDQLKELEKAHPLGLGSLADVARAATFLLAPQNSWITGTDLIVDGGFTAR